MSRDMQPRKSRSSGNRKKSGGGTLIGLFLGLVIGVVAAGVVWYINKSPTPFADKGQRPPTAFPPMVTAAAHPRRWRCPAKPPRTHGPCADDHRRRQAALRLLQDPSGNRGCDPFDSGFRRPEPIGAEAVGCREGEAGQGRCAQGARVSADRFLPERRRRRQTRKPSWR